MLDLIDVSDLLILRIGNANTIVELRVAGDIDVFVDRCAQHRPAELLVKPRDVAASTDKAHPQRGAADNHAASRPRIASNETTISACAAEAATVGVSSSARPALVARASSRDIPRTSRSSMTRCLRDASSSVTKTRTMRR